MATRAEIELKYDMQLTRFDDKINNLKSQIIRNEEQKARIVDQKEKELKNAKEEVAEDAQGAITTTSVGNTATAGGQANYAPSMGVVSRVGFMPPKKFKKKKGKKAYKEYLESYTRN
jgi:hypothetical protein